VKSFKHFGPGIIVHIPWKLSKWSSLENVETVTTHQDLRLEYS
jgi:hypothetical protein